MDNEKNMTDEEIAQEEENLRERTDLYYQFQKRQSKGELWRGILIGILSTLLVGVLAFTTVMIIKVANMKDGTGDNDVTATALEVIEDPAVSKKLNLLGTMIDLNYYKELNKEDLTTYLYKGLVAGLGDPYSAYYSEEELQAIVDDMNGSYFGIGVTMSPDSKTGLVSVVKVAENSPAREQGVQVGDYIYKVDDVDITGEELSKVASKVRGEEGTQVKLTIIREGEEQPIDFMVTRKSIESILVRGEMLSDNIGYIKIAEFENVTTTQFEEIYQSLLKKGMQALVLDLRDNPGGQIDIVNDIGQRFLPKGVMTYLMDKKGNRQDYSCDGEDAFDKPLAVLVNGNSASASEILAGAIKDYKVGTLFGTQTYGKGIVQMTRSLGDGTALKLTFAKYYTPSGNNIHGVGITPDVAVEPDKKLAQQTDSKESDNQLQEAVSSLKMKLGQ